MTIEPVPSLGQVNDPFSSLDPTTLMPSIGSTRFGDDDDPTTPWSEASGAAVNVTPAGSTGEGGRYRRITELGHGGWGVVERAVDRVLQREVAVKRIRAARDVSQEIRRRFLHEARITSQLQHPGVVPVHELAIGDHGDIYYVMKLLDGECLREHVRRQHATGKGDSDRWTHQTLMSAVAPLLDRFIDICQAIGYAHERGVIHRDLKPQNVMVGAFGETIVVDWGLAKKYREPISCNPPTAGSAPIIKQSSVAESHGGKKDSASIPGDPRHWLTEASDPQTLYGTLVGTPGYLSPEQSLGDSARVGPASDIYSLGIILYEMIGGEHPLAGRDMIAMIEATRAGAIPPIHEAQPYVPKPLAAICHRALAYLPEDRYASALELAEDVRRFIAGDEVSVYRATWVDRLARRALRHRGVTLTIAIATAMLLISSAGFGIVVHQAHQAEQVARLEAEAAHLEAEAAHLETLELLEKIDAEAALARWPSLSMQE